MSYILEALKKAEAERSAARSPELQALPTFAHLDNADTKASHKKWLWAALSAGVVCLAAVGWYVTRDHLPMATPAVPDSAPIAKQTEKPATAVPPLASAESAAQAASPTPPAPSPQTAATAPQAPSMAAREPVTATPAKPAERSAASSTKKSAEKSAGRSAEKSAEKPAEKRPKKVVEKKQAQATESDRTSPPPAEAPIATLRELPEQIQREIPPLSIGGYIYSGNKADRTVLINKRLLREGDEVAPGLWLEKMTPSGMVLNYKGYRYRRSY